MERKQYHFGSVPDQLRVIGILVYAGCLLACLCRLISHLHPAYVSAHELRCVYSVECLLWLPSAWKYKAAKSTVALMTTLLIFNPVAPVRGLGWGWWQCLNILALCIMGVSAAAILKRREREIEAFPPWYLDEKTKEDGS